MTTSRRSSRDSVKQQSRKPLRASGSRCVVPGSRRGNDRRELYPRRNPELRKHVSQVRVDRVRGDDQSRGDRSVRRSFRHQLGDPPLAVGKALPSRRWADPRPAFHPVCDEPLRGATAGRTTCAIARSTRRPLSRPGRIRLADDACGLLPELLRAAVASVPLAEPRSVSLLSSWVGRGGVLHSTLAQFPIIGDQLQDNIHVLRANAVGLVVGLVGFLWGARGVTQAASMPWPRSGTFQASTGPASQPARCAGCCCCCCCWSSPWA